VAATHDLRSDRKEVLILETGPEDVGEQNRRSGVSNGGLEGGAWPTRAGGKEGLWRRVEARPEEKGCDLFAGWTSAFSEHDAGLVWTWVDLEGVD
jgi:hypothetical protein